MRLLRVIASMDPVKGGPCQGIRNSVPELEKLGVHNEVVCLDDPAAPFLNDPFLTHALGPAKSPWCYSPRLLPWLLQNMSRFDAVLVHGLWLYHGHATRKALEAFKRKQAQKGFEKIPKLFVMPHGMLDPYFQKATGRKLKALRNWFYWKLVEEKIINKAAALLFTCTAEQELAKLPFRPYHPRQEICVGYGIAEPPLFKRSMQSAFLAQCPGLVNQPYFLFLSRIHEKKGVDLLIQAYAAVVNDVLRSSEKNRLCCTPNGQPLSKGHRAPLVPRLVIAGPGLETAYGQRIWKRVNEDPVLHRSVFFPGMLTGPAKWGAFYGCEAFVLPSHQENFGIAVVEALACKKPVLISRQVNIWEEIEAAGGGIAAADTLQGTIELLTQWLDMSVDEQLKMAANARNTFKKSFSVAPFAQSLQAVLLAH